MAAEGLSDLTFTPGSYNQWLNKRVRAASMAEFSNLADFRKLVRAVAADLRAPLDLEHLEALYPPAQEIHDELENRISFWSRAARKYDAFGRPVEAKLRERREIVDPLINSEHNQFHTWSELALTFTSDFRLSIKAPGIDTCKNFNEIGFADGRTKNPNQAWRLLRVMAENNGVLDLDTIPRVKRASLEKAVQKLRRILKDLFRLEEDPLELVMKVGYRTNFSLKCAPSYET